jgi:hypothetical protein
MQSGSFDNGERTVVLLGDPVLNETMAGLQFRISPSAFFQGITGRCFFIYYLFILTSRGCWQ